MQRGKRWDIVPGRYRRMDPLAGVLQADRLLGYCQMGLSLLGPQYAGVDLAGAALAARRVVMSSLRRMRG